MKMSVLVGRHVTVIANRPRELGHSVSIFSLSKDSSDKYGQFQFIDSSAFMKDNLHILGALEP